MDSEQVAYDELCCYTLGHPDPAFIHQHVVDAFAGQQGDEHKKPITLTFGLVGLYLKIEKHFSGKQVQRAHMDLARQKRARPGFTLPPQRGSITAPDVMNVPAGPDRDKNIDAWCAAVWEAFKDTHKTVADL